MESACDQRQLSDSGQLHGTLNGINDTGMTTACKHDEAPVPHIDDQGLFVQHLVHHPVPVFDLIQTRRLRAKLPRRPLERRDPRNLPRGQYPGTQLNGISAEDEAPARLLDILRSKSIIVDAGNATVRHYSVPWQESVWVGRDPSVLARKL